MGQTEDNLNLGLPEQESVSNQMHIGEHKPDLLSQEETSPHQAAFTQQPQQTTDDTNKDIQILSAKMDALKAILDNINQRLTNIERIANESQHNEKYERY